MWGRASGDDCCGGLRDTAMRSAGANIAPEDGMFQRQGARIGH